MFFKKKFMLAFLYNFNSCYSAGNEGKAYA